MSVLSDVYAYQISHSVRDFMPHFTTNFSPFAVRIRPGKRREESGSKNLNIKNPNMTGQSSTGSTASSARWIFKFVFCIWKIEIMIFHCWYLNVFSSSVDTSSDEDESHHQMNDSLSASRNSSEFVTFESLFPSMKEYYGMQPEDPKRNDYRLYKRLTIQKMNCVKFVQFLFEIFNCINFNFVLFIF